MAADPKTAPRRKREELRELVLDAAVELLRRDGLDVQLTSITYKQVFDHLEATQGIRVTRGSVHERIWESQEAFQTEALERASLWRTISTEATTNAATEALQGARGLTGWEVLAHVVKAAAPVAQEVSETGGVYQSWVGLTLAIAGRQDGDDRYTSVKESVSRSYAESTQELASMYRGLAEAIGLRLIPGRFKSSTEAWTTLSKLGMALSEGATLRTRFDETELAEIHLAVGEGDEPELWHPFAIGMLALLRFFLEPDPDR